MTETTGGTSQDQAYEIAIEQYKSSRLALSKCQINIEVAQMTKDMDALRVALSVENRLRCNVDDARENVKVAAYEIMRRKGMVAQKEPEKPKTGLLQKIIKIVQS